MKKIYGIPELDIIKFGVEDICNASGLNVVAAGDGDSNDFNTLFGQNG